jgi:hypothetical protein
MRSTGPTANPADSVNRKGADDADPAATQAAGEVPCGQLAVAVAVITIVYEPGARVAKLHVGVTLPSIARGSVHAGPGLPLTVIDTAVGCGPVVGYGFAVRIGPA